MKLIAGHIVSRNASYKIHVFLLYATMSHVLTPAQILLFFCPIDWRSLQLRPPLVLLSTTTSRGFLLAIELVLPLEIATCKTSFDHTVYELAV